MCVCVCVHHLSRLNYTRQTAELNKGWSGQSERDSVSKTELDSQVKRERENVCVREIDNKLGDRVRGQKAVLPVWAKSSAVCLIYSERQLGFG